MNSRSTFAAIADSAGTRGPLLSILLPRSVLYVTAIAAGLTAGTAAADWPDPDRDGYTEHRCDDTVGYCPADTEVLACHYDGNRPLYRNDTPCLTVDGKPPAAGGACSCNHPDGCYSDCALNPPCDESEDSRRCETQMVSIDYAGRTVDHVFEHEPVEFRLTRTGAAHDILNVAVTVSESGNMLNADDEGRKVVRFHADGSTATFSPGIVDDGEDEPHSTVRVSLLDDLRYSVNAPGEAAVEVRDDDGVVVEVSIDPLTRTVGEDGTAVFDVVSNTAADGTVESVDDLLRLFGTNSFAVAWRTIARDAESPADFHPISELVSVPFDRFEAENDRFVMRWTLPGIATISDEVEEGEERFDVVLERTPGLQSGIRIRNGSATGVVTIRDRVIGDLRLVDGDAPHEGRLEIFYDGEWGTVCDDFWTDTEARVACRQLGFEGSEPGGGRFLNGHFASGTGPIWLDNVLCAGSEARLIDCPRVDEGLEIGGHNCDHTEDVGIRCLTAQATTSTADRSATAAWVAAQNPGSTSLNAANRGITDPTVFAAFTGLRRLDLAGNAVSDLSALSELTALAWLDLSHNQIAEIAPLAQLPDLRYLALTDNRVVDISPLAALRQLEVLLLDGNEVADLEPLNELTQLRYLVLAGNRIADLRPLAGAEGLERLDLQGNPVYDTSPLNDLHNLVWLRVPSTTDLAVTRVSLPGNLRTLLVGNAVARPINRE